MKANSIIWYAVKRLARGLDNSLDQYKTQDISCPDDTITAGSNPLSSKRTIVLLGIGHTNAHIVQKWATQPIPNCRLVCISRFPFTTYSGMLPGMLAKQFAPSDMQIPLAPLAKQADAKLILDEVVRLDSKQRKLSFANHDSISFDALSIGIGSIPTGCMDFDSPSLVPIKPMQTFVDRLEQRMKQVKPSAACVVVGGGVAGIEIALCLKARLACSSSHHAASVTMVTRGEKLAAEMSDTSQNRLSQILSRHSIQVVKNFEVINVNQASVQDHNGNQQAADIVIWATGAAPPPLLSNLGIPTAEDGFLATTSTLQTIADSAIFAVGDSGTIQSNPSAKAGVYAVRQAPVLWNNLQAILDSSTAMKAFDPQADFLKLLNTSDGKALMQYGRWTVHARWCWWLKCWIDQRFIRQYQVQTDTTKRAD